MLLCFCCKGKREGKRCRDGEAWGSEEPENEIYELGLQILYFTAEMAKELGLNRDEGVTLTSEIKKDLLFMFQSQPWFR